MLSTLTESSDEIKDYDKIIKESIKENFFNEQEDKFESVILNDLNIVNEITNLYESENLNIFNVYFYFKINEENENTIMIESDELNIDTQNVSDLLSNIIKKINSRKINVNIKNNDFILSLKENENIDFYNDNYELRPYDKNSNSPKYGCSCFSSSITLDELIDLEICFVVKKSTNIKLTQKSVDEN